MGFGWTVTGSLNDISNRTVSHSGSDNLWFIACFTNREYGTMVLICPCSSYSYLFGVQGNHGELNNHSF